MVKFPSLSPTMTTGNLQRWNIAVGYAECRGSLAWPGSLGVLSPQCRAFPLQPPPPPISHRDEIATGDSLADVETDKAVMSFDSTEDGFVAKLLVSDGTAGITIGQVRSPPSLGRRPGFAHRARPTVPFLSSLLLLRQPVMVLVESKDSIAAFKDFVPTASTSVCNSAWHCCCFICRLPSPAWSLPSAGQTGNLSQARRPRRPRRRPRRPYFTCCSPSVFLCSAIPGKQWQPSPTTPHRVSRADTLQHDTCTRPRLRPPPESVSLLPRWPVALQKQPASPSAISKVRPASCIGHPDRKRCTAWRRVPGK